MGKYLELAKQYGEKFKPVVGKEVRVNLEDIVVRDHIYDYYTHNMNDASMYVWPRGSTVYVYENNIGKKDEPESFTPVAVVHELLHITQDRLFEKKYEKLKAKPILSIYANWILRRYDKASAFHEGFAVYTSLNHMKEIYNQTIKKYTCKTENDLGPHNFGRTPIYIQGYKFFKKVLNTIGKDKLWEVATSPPLYKLEVRIPILYLLRQYPKEWIKSILASFWKKI